MTRLALTIVLTAAAGGAAIVTHHNKRPMQARPMPASVQSLPLPLNVRASRAEHRLPLLLAPATPSTSPRRGVRRPVGSHPRPRPARSASSSGSYADTTMYCSTGNRNAAGRWPRLGDVAVIDRSIPFGTRVIIAGRAYTVADWIGSGSQFDIFGGDDDGCEQRALDYGRRHLRVVVER